MADGAGRVAGDMQLTPRVLDPIPVADLSAYEAAGGGRGLRTAIEGGGDAVLAVLAASGLRGRGGAGFPTATKWSSILDNLSGDLAPTVVINAAEGEPGSFKDRAIIRANPYRVLEGALIAAVVVGADAVVVATKASFGREVTRLRRAAEDLAAAPWVPDISISVIEGPDEYLYGEETAMLEVVEGRQPFPRIAPPWRRGVDAPDVSSDQPGDGAIDAGTISPPTLVNNAETMANVALIVAEGPEWFRELGTEQSPGTVVCTVSGDVANAGVIEVPMGTPLRDVLAEVAGPEAASLVAVLPGVSSGIIPAERFDTPLTYEDLKAIGSGLGTAGFIAVGPRTDPMAVAHGVSRFLAIESCGQCTPCKQDGLAIAGALGRLVDGGASSTEVEVVSAKLRTVEDGARCFLATQHQQVVTSILDAFPTELAARTMPTAGAAGGFLVAELVDLVDGPEGVESVVDLRHRDKQPDWTYDAEDSGQAPADRLDQGSGASTAS